MTRYIVGFKDSAKAKTLYFGPFASESAADFFVAALPNPLEDGWVRIVTLQPFMAHEARSVAAIIQRNREASQVKGRQLVA